MKGDAFKLSLENPISIWFQFSLEDIICWVGITKKKKLKKISKKVFKTYNFKKEN